MRKKESGNQSDAELSCGLVMPISAIDGCSAEHWVEVKNIICDAIGGIEELVFVPRLVSEQDDVGVIQKRIVQNIYSSDIVICDVSCKNANVMFELGMRLAFDKPTILIKDDKTDFSFDTGVIEHLVYPRDLRFSRVVSFKKSLADKVLATYLAAKNDPNHSTFLKNFGSFKIASVDQTVVTADQALLDMMQDLSREVSRIGRKVSSLGALNSEAATGEFVADLIASINAFKEANPGVAVDGCINNQLFYSCVLENTRMTGQYKTYAQFKKAVDDFCRANPHLFN